MVRSFFDPSILKQMMPKEGANAAAPMMDFFKQMMPQQDGANGSNQMMDMFKQMMPKQGLSSTPVFDMKIIMETQRKNMQAMTDAVQLGMEGVQQLMSAQAELVGRMVQDNSTITTAIMSEGTPEQKIQRQAEMMRKSYEQTIKGARELSAMASKSQEDAAEIINRRVTASLSEFKFAFDAPAGAAQARRASDAAFDAAEAAVRTTSKAATKAATKTVKKTTRKAKAANRSTRSKARKAA